MGFAKKVFIKNFGKSVDNADTAVYNESRQAENGQKTKGDKKWKTNGTQCSTVTTLTGTTELEPAAKSQENNAGNDREVINNDYLWALQQGKWLS